MGLFADLISKPWSPVGKGQDANLFVARTYAGPFWVAVTLNKAW